MLPVSWLRQPCSVSPTLADTIIPAAIALADPRMSCEGLSTKKNGMAPIPVESAVIQPKNQTDCREGVALRSQSFFGKVT